MMTFREFVENKNKNKPWIAKKKDIIQLWNSLSPELPINPSPVSKYHSGNRFDQDGIRITGSSKFVNSILARIKPFLIYVDHPLLDLDVKYRQVIKRKKTIDSNPSFACYINVIEKKDQS